MKSDRLSCDLCGSTGIHSGADVIKILLAGGAATQVVSAIFNNGEEHIPVMLKDIEEWMNRKGYNNISEFAGLMRHHMETDTPVSFERMQFMNYYLPKLTNV
jgi:dihydroorotate dehydrogenase (fumarate)